MSINFHLVVRIAGNESNRFPYCCCLNMILEESNIVDEASLNPACQIRVRSVDTYQTVLMLKRAKLVIVITFPRQKSDDLDSIEMYGSQHLRQEILVGPFWQRGSSLTTQASLPCRHRGYYLRHL